MLYVKEKKIEPNFLHQRRSCIPYMNQVDSSSLKKYISNF